MLDALTHHVSTDLPMRRIWEAEGNPGLQHHRFLEDAMIVLWYDFQTNPARKPSPKGWVPALRPHCLGQQAWLPTLLGYLHPHLPTMLPRTRSYCFLPAAHMIFVHITLTCQNLFPTSHLRGTVFKYLSLGPVAMTFINEVSLPG